MAYDDFLSERRKLMAGIVRRSFQTLRKAALMNEILIFESGDHPVQVRLTGETVWLSQSQMAELFGTVSNYRGFLGGSSGRIETGEITNWLTSTRRGTK
jgi:hypothetical protein